MTVQLHGRDVDDLMAAANGYATECTHFIVAVDRQTGVQDFDWHARPHKDAQIFAAVKRSEMGRRYRIEVRPVRNSRHWFWGTAA